MDIENQEPKSAEEANPSAGASTELSRTSSGQEKGVKKYIFDY